MNKEAYRIEYASNEFNSEIDRLVTKKKFRKLPNQINELWNELEKGDFSGTVIAHSDEPPYDVYKTRLPNEDMNVGKSNGYRIIYLVRHDAHIVGFLLIYYKKELETVVESYIKALIDGYFLSLLPEENELLP